MKIERVGVVGCGLMGSGIAQVCAQSGYTTRVSEVNEALLNRGLGSLRSGLEKVVEKGKMPASEKDAILSRLKGTTKLEDFSDCDIVIEAVIENMAEKRKVFSTLDKICPRHAILASNTSCLSLIDMAVATSRPAQFIGMHFFNPVPVMKLVELITTITTSAETLEQCRAFSTSLGKEIVITRDNPGFIVNRLLLPYILEAVRLYESGMATREDIDKAVNLGLNHPMGPLALMDLMGLDTAIFVSNAIYEETRDPKYIAPQLLKKMVAAGHLGRKSGKGFYDYSKK